MEAVAVRAATSLRQFASSSSVSGLSSSSSSQREFQPKCLAPRRCRADQRSRDSWFQCPNNGRRMCVAPARVFPLSMAGRENGHPAQPRLQDLDPNTMLLQQRIIFLGGQVDDFSADVIISQMLLLDAQDPSQDIKIFINSPGGSVTAGMGIYDAMKLCKADVSTTCFGLAASMGAFLLAAGAKGKRYCMPNARVMIHQPLGGAQGSAIEVGLQVREMMYHKKKLGKIMSRLTGQTEEQIDIDTDRDNFMNAWQAVNYGLVDHVINDGKPGLVAPLGEIKEPPKTRVWDYWTVKEGKERKQLPTEQENFHGGRKFADRKEDELEESKEQEKAAV